MQKSVVLYLHLLALTCIYAKTQNAEFSPEEKMKLQKLTQLTSDMLTKDYMKTDGYLIRWLRTKNMDVDASMSLLNQTLKWRGENNIDKLSKEEPIPELARSPFYNMDSKDKEGRPVILFEMAKFNVRKYALGGQSKPFIRFFIQIFERAEDRIHELVKAGTFLPTISQGVIVYDMTGYNLRQQGCIACFPILGSIMNTYERHYPSIFSNIVVLNAPRIFTPLLEFLKPLMSENTRNVHRIYGQDQGEWQPKLLESISVDQLPLKLGGTKT